MTSGDGTDSASKDSAGGILLPGTGSLVAPRPLTSAWKDPTTTTTTSSASHQGKKTTTATTKTQSKPAVVEEDDITTLDETNRR